MYQGCVSAWSRRRGWDQSDHEVPSIFLILDNPLGRLIVLRRYLAGTAPKILEGALAAVVSTMLTKFVRADCNVSGLVALEASLLNRAGANGLRPPATNSR